MADFDIAYRKLATFEGEYSNDPDDKGGETYAGISRVYFPNWQGWQIIDEIKASISPSKSALFGKACNENLSLCSLVKTWYRHEWWDKLMLVEFEQSVADEIFEEAVNLGMSGCGKKLQTVCNAFNRGPYGNQFFSDLKIDGAIGPKTIRALKIILRYCIAKNIVHALNCMQGAHYLEVAAKNSSQRKFIAGWMKRTHCHD